MPEVQVQTTPAPAPAPIVAPSVDTQLSSLFAQSENAYVAIVQYVDTTMQGDEEQKRAIVKLTLMAPKDKGGRGMKKESANSYVTYLFNLLKPENASVKQELYDGKITQVESRTRAKSGSNAGNKQGSTRTGSTQQVSPEEHLRAAARTCAKLALNIAAAKKETLSFEQFSIVLKEAFDFIVKENAELAAKAAASPSKGSVDTQPAEQAQATPEQPAPASAPKHSKKAA